MRFLRQSLIGVFLAAVSLGLLVYAGQLIGSAVQASLARDTKSPPARERVFTVTLRTAAETTETPVLQGFGAVHSRRTLELRAASGGRVIELAEAFEDGGQVKAGEVLIRVDPADAQSALARARADLADAKAEVVDAERGFALAIDEQSAAQEQADLRQSAFQRQEDLRSRGVGTAAAVETAELAAASARQAVLARRQAVSQAEARIDKAATSLARVDIALAEAQRRLDDTVLLAPFDGTLSGTSVVAGRLVSANEKLAELIDPAALEVSFRVSTAQYARLLDGDGALLQAEASATLDVAGIDLVASGRLSRASASAGEGQTGRLVFADIGQAVGFQPGDFVTVRVQEPALERVVRLPSAAMDAAETVLVLGAEGRLEVVDVRLVRRQGDDILVRAEGLVGREVVQARSPLLGAGISVKPLRGEVVVPEAPEMLELSEERRARLIAFIEGNARMPAEAKARVLARLAEAKVPARMVARIEDRMGG